MGFSSFAASDSDAPLLPEYAEDVTRGCQVRQCYGTCCDLVTPSPDFLFRETIARVTFDAVGQCIVPRFGDNGRRTVGHSR
jgi:hypothetical protein